MAGRVHVKVTFYGGKVTGVVGSQTREAARRAANRTRDRARDIVMAEGRIDTGEMLQGITVVPKASGDPMRPTYRVTSRAKHSMFNEKGTRAHGPRRANFMVFTPKGSSTKVFAKWVRGITGIHFMRRALQGVSTRDYVR